MDVRPEFAAHLQRWTEKDMLRSAIVFVLTTSTVVAALEPRGVAEEALAAWHAGDAQRLEAVAHPELMKRCRDARILRFDVEGKKEKEKILVSGSEAEVMSLLCEALRAIVPGKERVEHTDRYLETDWKEGLAIVVFDSVSKPAGSSSAGVPMRTEVVLKKVGEDWRFLWSPAVQLHVDLTWNPKE